MTESSPYRHQHWFQMVSNQGYWHCRIACISGLVISVVVDLSSTGAAGPETGLQPENVADAWYFVVSMPLEKETEVTVQATMILLPVLVRPQSKP